MTQLHVDRAVLDGRVDEVRQSPTDVGRVELIVCRPENRVRAVLESAVIDLDHGMVGDNWRTRGSSSTPDGSSNPLSQITMMNARAASLIAGDRDRWPLAGDQLYVDFDISGANVPPETQLSLGSVILEVTEKPHTGCTKFSARFGGDAWRFVKSPTGRELNLRGINTRVVQSGVVGVGDAIRKI